MSPPLQLRPSPALLIIDMQNGFCHSEGSFAKLGLPATRNLTIVPAINELRKLFHEHGLPVIYTREGWNEDYSDSGILLDSDLFKPLKELKGFIRGTWDFEIIDDLAPDIEAKGEIVLDKTRNTAFWGTNLAERLRVMGVDQLVATGVGTNVCVESTVRDAITNGFHTVTVSDATATLSEEEHKASLMNLQYFGGIATMVEVKMAIGNLKNRKN